MGFKYIVFKVRDRELPVIFPDTMIHSFMAKAIQRYYAIEAQEMGARQEMVIPVSAGQLLLNVTWAGDKSETLKLEARPGDAEFINWFPYNHGVVIEED